MEVKESIVCMCVADQRGPVDEESSRCQTCLLVSLRPPAALLRPCLAGSCFPPCGSLTNGTQTPLMAASVTRAMDKRKRSKERGGDWGVRGGCYQGNVGLIRRSSLARNDVRLHTLLVPRSGA